MEKSMDKDQHWDNELMQHLAEPHTEECEGCEDVYQFGELEEHGRLIPRLLCPVCRREEIVEDMSEEEYEEYRRNNRDNGNDNGEVPRPRDPEDGSGGILDSVPSGSRGPMAL